MCHSYLCELPLIDQGLLRLTLSNHSRRRVKKTFFIRRKDFRGKRFARYLSDIKIWTPAGQACRSRKSGAEAVVYLVRVRRVWIGMIYSISFIALTGNEKQAASDSSPYQPGHQAPGWYRPGCHWLLWSAVLFLRLITFRWGAALKHLAISISGPLVLRTVFISEIRNGRYRRS